ncbi:MAG: 30S ribosomal protein S20 [Nitrospirae bacterium]|nr:30S ribosomal protein S20 [Nitrospirota bacterium]
MPATKSAKKRLKTDKKKRDRNLKVKKSLKVLIKGFNQTIELKKEEEAKGAFLKASSALDRAASKGVIHKNTAWRKKSRLAKKVNKLTTASS